MWVTDEVGMGVTVADTVEDTEALRLGVDVSGGVMLALIVVVPLVEWVLEADTEDVVLWLLLTVAVGAGVIVKVAVTEELCDLVPVIELVGAGLMDAERVELPLTEWDLVELPEPVWDGVSAGVVVAVAV